MSSKLAKGFLITVAVLANLAIAANQARAGYKNGLCTDGEGDTVACCRPCLFFCECTVVVVE